MEKSHFKNSIVTSSIILQEQSRFGSSVITVKSEKKVSKVIASGGFVTSVYITYVCGSTSQVLLIALQTCNEETPGNANASKLG